MSGRVKSILILFSIVSILVIVSAFIINYLNDIFLERVHRTSHRDTARLIETSTDYVEDVLSRRMENMVRVNRRLKENLVSGHSEKIRHSVLPRFRALKREYSSLQYLKIFGPEGTLVTRIGEKTNGSCHNCLGTSAACDTLTKKEGYSGFEFSEQDIRYKIIKPLDFHETFAGAMEWSFSPLFLIRPLESFSRNRVLILIPKSIYRNLECDQLEKKIRMLQNYAVLETDTEDYSNLPSDLHLNMDRATLIHIGAKHYHLHPHPLQNHEGSTLAYLVIMEDITRAMDNYQRTRNTIILTALFILVISFPIVYYSYGNLIRDLGSTEKILAQQLNFTQTLIETIPLPVLYKHTNLRFLGCNTAYEQFRSLKREDIIGKDVHSILPKEVADIHREQDLKLLTRGGSLEYQVTQRTDDGDEQHILYSKALFHDRKGNPAGIIAIINDMTDSINQTNEIEKARDFLNNVFKSLNHPFFIIDVKTRHITMANPATGLKEDEGSIRCHELFHNLGETCPPGEYVCPIELVLAERKPVTLEHRHVDRNGNTTDHEIHAHPIFEKDGSITQIIQYTLDISHRKEAQKELVKSERKFRDLVTNMPVGLITIDTQGSVTNVNPTMLRMLGSPSEEATREINVLTYPPLIEAGFSREITRCMDDNREITFESIYTSKWGKTFHFRAIFTPIHEEGKVNGAQGVLEDITDLKEAQEEILRLTTAVEQSANSIVITDTGGNIVFVNTHFELSTGYSREEALGENPRILKTELHPPEVYENLWKTITAGKVWRGEFHNRRKDGSTFWERATISPVRNVKGEITHYLAIKEDITELKKTEDELLRAKEEAERASETKNIFLANISHEIRTPMNGIIGMNDLLLETDLDEKQKDYALTIRNSAIVLMNLINDILDISRIEAGKMALEEEVFNLPELMNNTLKMFYNDAQKSGIDLELNLDEKLPVHVLGSPSRLTQVLSNLLSNALKFTSEGSITLAADRLHEDREMLLLHIKVTDTGIGISPGDRQSLFRPFTQVRRSISHRKGTGLGLAISRHLIEMMGGEIGVKSEPGEGSTFEFTLLLKKADVNKDEKQHNGYKDDSGSPCNHACHILIVEDNETNLKLAQILLEKLGFTHRSALDGQEALDILEEEKFDCVFMDIQMPVMDGLEATRQFREREGEGEHTPVIAMTAYAMPGDREKCLESGMDDYMTKPVSRQVIMEKVQAWVRPSRG
jgi:hypothetical protein